MKKLVWLFILLYSPSLFPQKSMNMSVVANVNMDRYTNDVWGYVDSLGNEYALVGHATGVSIVQVTADGAEEIDFVAGVASIWRDLKTHGHYAYITTDQGQDGLMILDLSALPDSVRLVGFYQSGLATAHNLYIADGFAYLAGSNRFLGVDILDLSNPEAPVQAGGSHFSYFHDVYVRNDTLYASTGRRSSLAIFDVSRKAAPALLAEIPFPSRGYSHNSWLSADGDYIMTTEESVGQTVKIWDIRNLSNPELVDQYLSSTRLAHNAHIRGDFAYISHYADGIRVLDVSDPTLMVEVGYFDTSPSTSANFDGCWGAYPFTPSGFVYATDQETGLFVLEFNGKRASRIKGWVFDAETGVAIANAQVEVGNAERTIASDLTGEYRLGLTEPGTFALRAFSAGYDTAEITVTVSEGETEIENFFLTPRAVTQVSADAAAQPERFRLEQNFPNPFNAGTEIRYGLPAQSHVELRIYNAIGNDIRTLVLGQKPAGEHRAQWDGQDDSGREMASGVYFYRIRAGSFVRTQKMIMLR